MVCCSGVTLGGRLASTESKREVSIVRVKSSDLQY